MGPNWTADTLAEWCSSLSPGDLPDAVIAKAEDCVLDAIACAMLGRSSPSTQAVERMAFNTYRDGPATVWFGGKALSPIGAAFINATAASILDIDDGHRAALGHPGAAVVPAALASANARDSSGMVFLAAVIAGYETSVRIGTSENRKAYHTGNWSCFGAATAVAYLSELNNEQHSQALAITSYHGPKVGDLTLSKDMGRSVKESIPWSVVVGMSSADLAEQGFTGCRDGLDIEDRFLPGIATKDLGQNHMILGTYFKRYSACRWMHSAVELLLELMSQHQLTSDNIYSVHVGTFKQAVDLDNLVDPPSLESAQYSLRYCLGLVATKGEQSLMPLSDDSLHQQQAIDFANRVQLAVDPHMDDKFPERAAACVKLETSKGPFTAERDKPWGEPDSTIGRTDLVEKFHTLAAGVMPAKRVDAIITAVEGLKDGNTKSLTKALQEPIECI